MKVVAKAVLVDTDGKMLVLRRSKTHPRFAYHLDFPGGEVELDEAEAQAVTREIEEEAGISVPVSILRLVHEEQLPNKLYKVYLAELTEAQPSVELSWEHDQYEWLTTRELLDRPLPPGVDSYYQTALRYIASRPVE